MQSKASVTVIIPMCRAEKWIETAIQSVENQSWDRWELLLVNDGSPDRCGEICGMWAQKDERIRVISHERIRGISAARNTGVREARGDYIVFLDADDYAGPDYIEQMLRIADRHQVPLVCCNHLIVRGKTGKPRFPVSEAENRLDEEAAFRGILYHGVPDVSVWGKLIRRDLMAGIEYPEGKLFEDTYRIAELIHAAGEMVFYARPLYEYRIREGSISHGRFNAAQTDLIDAVDHMTDEIEKYCPGRMAEGIARRKLHACLSVRRLLAKEKTAYRQEKKELDERILSEAEQIHASGSLTGRDRAAVRALKMGDRCFDTLWRIYERCR